MTASAPDGLAPKRRRWRWIVLIILLFCGLGGAYLYLRDGPPPDDSDLMERDPVVPEDQNGLIQLRKINLKLIDFDGFADSLGVDIVSAMKIENGEAANDTLVHDFLSQVQPEIVKLQGIVELPHFAFNDKISTSTLFPEFNLEMRLAHALVLAAREAQHDGDYAQAVQDVLLIRRLVVRTTEMRGALIQSLTTVACEGIIAREVVELLNDPALPPREEALLAQAYADEGSWNMMMIHSMDIEYQFAKSAVKEFKQNNRGMFPAPTNNWEVAWGRLTLHENATDSEIAAYYRTIRQQWNGPYAAVNFPAVASPSYPGPHSGITYYLAPNFGGRFLLDTVQPSWSAVIMYPYLLAADDRLLRTGFALRHFYDNQHMLPAKLDDLVPQYLPAVPLDPFDDKPLRYNAAKGLVYSVGTWLKDYGGSNHLGKTSATDPDYMEPILDKEQPTLELKFQKPPAPATPAPAP